jgi:CBS domain-containing protein
MTIAAILKMKGTEVATVRPGVSIGQAAKMLAERQIGSLVVVDQARAVIGIFSERDLVRAVAQGGTQALEGPVEAAMSSPVSTCREDETVDRIMGLMTAGRFRHVPVVEQGELRGIVSIGDIVKHKLAEAEMETAAMRAYITTG